MRIHRAYSRFHQGAFRRAEVRPACQWVSFFSSCRVMVCWLNRAFRARASISPAETAARAWTEEGPDATGAEAGGLGVPGPSPGGAEGGLPGGAEGPDSGEPAPRGAIRGSFSGWEGEAGDSSWAGFVVSAASWVEGSPICRVGIRLGLRSCGLFTVEGGGYAVRRSGLQGNPTHTQAGTPPTRGRFRRLLPPKRPPWHPPGSR